MPNRAESGPLVAVLAAGLASRFGGDKLDAPLLGKSVGQWVLDSVATAGLAPGVAIVGPQAPAFVQAAAGWDQVVNPQPEAGLGGSVALACRHALLRRRDVLLVLADMPLVAPEHLRALALAPHHAATRYPDGRLGVPALIRRQALEPFCTLGGERGAGPLLAGLAPLCPVNAAPEMLADIDRPQDLARTAGQLNRGSQP